MATFTYEFEELPLVIAKGVPAALTNGCVEIRYSSDGEWTIISVCVEGYQETSQEERAAGKRPWVYVPATFPLDHIIISRLECEWRGRVSSAVSDQLEIDCECAAEDRADRIRQERMEVA